MLQSILHKNIPHTRPLVSPGSVNQIMPYLSNLHYNGNVVSLVTSTVICLTAAKFKTLILSECDFTLSYVANISIFVSLYDLYLLPGYFCNKIIHVQNCESHIQFIDQCAPFKVINGVENHVLKVSQSQKKAVCCDL
jgi:hypothetical protein